MSVSPNERNKNRRFHTPRAPWTPYIGNCKEIDDYLSEKNSVGWLIPKFINAMLRGVSQVLFVSNPFSGFMILLSIFWCDFVVGLAVLVSATTAIFTALLLGQDSSLISSGLTTYNAVLVGSVTASLWTPLFSESLTLKIWAFIILGSVVSVFVTSAFANMLSSYHISLPCLTLPFNIVILVLFASLMPPPKMTSMNIETTLSRQSVSLPPDIELTTSEMNNITTATTLGLQKKVNHTQSKYSTKEFLSSIAMSPSTASPSAHSAVSPVAPYLFNRAARASGQEPSHQFQSIQSKVTKNINGSDTDVDNGKENVLLDWGETFSGITRSMGQVFGINNLFSSIFIYMAVMIYSPILCLMFVVGATIGTFTGLTFVTEPFDSIYNGLWGYNGILSAGAVGGFFIVMTCHSFWTAVINILFTVLIQRTLMLSLASMRLPVFTLPFVLSTLIFLSVSSSGNQLPRVGNISVPEAHRYEFLKQQRQEKIDTKSDEVLETGEEKESALEEIKISNEESVRES